MQCIKKCKKKKRLININILNYNIFPVKGWIFNCFECETPTSNSMILDKFEIYICKYCQKKKKINKSFEQECINQCNSLYDNI